MFMEGYSRRLAAGWAGYRHFCHTPGLGYAELKRGVASKVPSCLEGYSLPLFPGLGWGVGQGRWVYGTSVLSFVVRDNGLLGGRKEPPFRRLGRLTIGRRLTTCPTRETAYWNDRFEMSPLSALSARLSGETIKTEPDS